MQAVNETGMGGLEKSFLGEQQCNEKDFILLNQVYGVPSHPPPPSLVSAATWGGAATLLDTNSCRGGVERASLGDMMGGIGQCPIRVAVVGGGQGNHKGVISLRYGVPSRRRAVSSRS